METTQWPDHVQLRLQMTSEQINAERERCRNIPMPEVEVSRPEWDGVTRAKPPYGKTPRYWRMQAQTARRIADSKANKNARKYWLKKAREYEDKAIER